MAQREREREREKEREMCRSNERQEDTGGKNKIEVAFDG